MNPIASIPDDPADLARRAAAGAAAHAVGYALVLLVMVPLVLGPVALSRLTTGAALVAGRWRVAGLLFYVAQGAPVLPGRGFTGVWATSFPWLGAPGMLVLTVVPAGVLFASGWLLAHRRSVDSAEAGARVGAALVPGYLLFVLVGVVVLSTGIPFRPATLPAVALAGVAWPLVFGGGGGALYALNEERGYADEATVAVALGGVAVGVGAFVAGVGLLTLVVEALYGRLLGSIPGWVDFFIDLLGIELPPPRKIAGWAFYNAHGVAIDAPVGLDKNPFDGDGIHVIQGTRNFVMGGPAAVLAVYPPLVLLVAGALAGWPARTRRGAGVAGVAVTLGYAPALVARASTYDHAISVDVAVKTFELTVRVVRGGWLSRAVLYPLVFGTVGSLLWFRYGPDMPFREWLPEV